MSHIGVHALGYRIEADGHVARLHAATRGPCEAAVELARGADLLLCEATWQEHMELLPFHLCGRQAAEHAAEAEGGTPGAHAHLRRPSTRTIARAEATQTFDGADRRRDPGGPVVFEVGGS